MGNKPPSVRPGVKWAVIFLCWTGFALFFTYQSYVAQAQYAKSIAWLNPLFTNLSWAYVWFAVMPLILYAAKHLPFQRKNVIRSVALHSATAALIFVLNTMIYVPVHSLLLGLGDNSRPLFGAIQHVVLTEVHIGLVVYWMIFGVYHGLNYYRRYREGELHAANLETRLVQAQLNALRMQLHPHFLFNTLNSISVLMRRDTEAADRMLLQLSNLLRVTLAGNAGHEIKLGQELEILKQYLEIEQIRFQDRLTVRMQIDPTILEALIPQLFFQPLVENAIRHGIADRETGGVIAICAARQNGRVHLQVRDNGPGLNGNFQEGVGLSNTRSRLNYLYGSAGQFKVYNAEEGGLVAAAEFPLHTEMLSEVGAKS